MGEVEAGLWWLRFGLYIVHTEYTGLDTIHSLLTSYPTPYVPTLPLLLKHDLLESTFIVLHSTHSVNFK